MRARKAYSALSPTTKPLASLLRTLPPECQDFCTAGRPLSTLPVVPFFSQKAGQCSIIESGTSSDGIREKLSFVGTLWVPEVCQKRTCGATIPVQRMVSPTRSSEDIAGPAAFLASDLSVCVTGHIIMADGGYRTV